jgi:hypothetical protein
MTDNRYPVDVAYQFGRTESGDQLAGDGRGKSYGMTYRTSDFSELPSQIMEH